MAEGDLPCCRSHHRVSVTSAGPFLPRDGSTRPALETADIAPRAEMRAPGPAGTRA